MQLQICWITTRHHVALRPDDPRVSQFGKLKLHSLRAEGDVTTEAKLGNDDWIDCGCIEFLQKNSISPSTPPGLAPWWTAPPPTWLAFSSSLSMSLVPLICSVNLRGVVRCSVSRRLLFFFSFHCCSRFRLRAAAAGLLLFLFCTAADRSATSSSSSSSQGLHIGVEGAVAVGEGAGSPFPQPPF